MQTDELIINQLSMDERLKVIVNHIVSEALYGWYERRNVNFGNDSAAFRMGYRALIRCLRDDDPSAILAKKVTRAILSAYWGHRLTQGDAGGTRYRNACFNVYKAINEQLERTLKLMDEEDAPKNNLPTI